MLWLASIIVFLYILDILLLAGFATHTYLMLWLYARNPGHCKRSNSSFAKALIARNLPLVSIHLPIFNEYYVIDRLLEAASKLDWPKNRLEIFVLDDSTDDTTKKVERLVSRLKRKGFRIRHIHRKERRGHKAGALREALDLTKAEFIAIFDADFVPSPDFLKSCMPAFADPDIGMVQTRWGHINADYSPLTRAQAIGIDGHFIVEQVARNANGLWMNFNGTAGIWRRQCILDAGNWQGDTLTEDFDLSYRAELAGWKFQYYSDVISPAELPARISAFKSQQFRWCKGSIQTALKLAGRIFRSDFSWKIKAEAFIHLFNYSVHPLMLLNILLVFPVLLLEPYLPFSGTLFSSKEVIAAAIVLLGAASIAPTVFYAYCQYRLYEDWPRRLLWLPVLMVIGTGVAVNNTRAWLEAVFGLHSSFVRTPKLRIESKKDRLENRKRYLPKGDFYAIFEILMGLYSLAMCYLAYLKDRSLIIPFLLLYAVGFLYMGIGSLKEGFQKKSKGSRKKILQKDIFQTKKQGEFQAK